MPQNMFPFSKTTEETAEEELGNFSALEHQTFSRQFRRGSSHFPEPQFSSWHSESFQNFDVNNRPSTLYERYPKNSSLKGLRKYHSKDSVKLGKDKSTSNSSISQPKPKVLCSTNFRITSSLDKMSKTQMAREKTPLKKSKPMNPEETQIKEYPDYAQNGAVCSVLNYPVNSNKIRRRNLLKMNKNNITEIVKLLKQ